MKRMLIDDQVRYSSPSYVTTLVHIRTYLNSQPHTYHNFQNHLHIYEFSPLCISHPLNIGDLDIRGVNSMKSYMGADEVMDLDTTLFGIDRKVAIPSDLVYINPHGLSRAIVHYRHQRSHHEADDRMNPLAIPSSFFDGAHKLSLYRTAIHSSLMAAESIAEAEVKYVYIFWLYVLVIVHIHVYMCECTSRIYTCKLDVRGYQSYICLIFTRNVFIDIWTN